MEEFFLIITFLAVIAILILVISLKVQTDKKIGVLSRMLIDLKYELKKGFTKEDRISKVMQNVRATQESMVKSSESLSSEIISPEIKVTDKEKINEEIFEEQTVEDLHPEQKLEKIDIPDQTIVDKIETTEKLNTETKTVPLLEKQDIIQDIDKKDFVKKTIDKEVFDEIIIEKKPKETIITETTEDKKQSQTQYQDIPIKKKKPGFWKRNPDLEKFIGEDLIMKIGIVILVLGLGFFVKYAIDEDWIGEIGRVGIGILSGGVLVAIAHYLHKKFKAFSSILVGGGLAVMYFTIALAFWEYDLFTQTVAFVILVVITSFAVLLSLAYDRYELAIFAILGGFASPIMVSTGGGNYQILFSYILILDIGMLVLAGFKKWNSVNIVSYVCTVILYVGWFIKEYNKYDISKLSETPVAFPFVGALIFISAFYLVFFLMNIVNNLRYKTKFKAIEITVLLSNTCWYYAFGMIILKDYNIAMQGIFTAFVAIFNFAFAFVLYKRVDVDRKFIFFLIGLVLTFVSLAAPVQLEGNYITLFWSVEMVLLLWLSQNTGIKLLKLSSILVLLLMFVSLVMDWAKLYVDYSVDAEVLTILANKAFITTIVSTTSLLFVIFLLKKEKTENFFPWISVKAYSGILTVFFIILLYIGLLLEINYQLLHYVDNAASISVYIGAYNFLYLLIIMMWMFSKKQNYLLAISSALGFIGILVYFTYYHIQFKDVRNAYILEQAVSLKPFMFHYLNIVLIVLVNIFVFANMKKLMIKEPVVSKLALWFMIAVLMFVLSSELDHLIVINYIKPLSVDILPDDFYDKFDVPLKAALSKSHRIGFPILWGVSAFVIMIIGMRKETKDLRIISLSLLFLILIKLGAIDIWDMSPAGKIAVLISLGILLLVLAFLYQKLKKFMLDEKPKE